VSLYTQIGSKIKFGRLKIFDGTHFSDEMLDSIPRLFRLQRKELKVITKTWALEKST